MVANICIEATARCGVELGYHVTLVRDATAAFSPEAMRAAHDINGPTQSRIFCARRRFSPCGMMEPLCGQERSVKWVIELLDRELPGLWEFNDITFTATRSKSNDFRAEHRDPLDMSRSQVRLLEPIR
jgi:hypothetical protein